MGLLAHTIEFQFYEAVIFCNEEEQKNVTNVQFLRLLISNLK